MAHEVVSQVKVGDILTVKKVFRHLFQAVTGQVNHADRLRHHLYEARGHRDTESVCLHWAYSGHSLVSVCLCCVCSCAQPSFMNTEVSGIRLYPYLLYSDS